ncbi:UNVERIFIED_CONTAM: hypothetical protein H355_013321 [Colinus virginianus]|nr:hypothetical protein H355_013321 [Colinus virginianus]
MGSREPCRRLEEVLGALYDLGGSQEVPLRPTGVDSRCCSGVAAVSLLDAQKKDGYLMEQLRGGVQHLLPNTRCQIQTKTMAEKKNVSKQEFNFEKARLEVHRFGITGYEKQEQRIWERERAIMLGAKPPKKEHVNYKIYQEKMKVKKTTKDDDKGQEHKSESQKKKKDLKARFTGALRGLWDDIHPSAEGSALLFNKDWPVLQEQMHLMKGNSVLTQVPGKQYG